MQMYLRSILKYFYLSKFVSQFLQRKNYKKEFIFFTLEKNMMIICFIFCYGHVKNSTYKNSFFPLLIILTITTKKNYIIMSHWHFKIRNSTMLSYLIVL